MSNELVSIEEQIKQQLALQQEKMSALSSKANLISFKGGQLIVDGMPVPGGEADVHVLATQGERSFYKGAFDPSVVQVPVCYSFDGTYPHPEATEPQADMCTLCPNNEWGSKGRGKACRESARVALVPASAPLASAPLYQASFPITSMGSVKDFFARCANSGKLSGQFVAKLRVVPDAKSFFKASLTPMQLAENQDLSTLMERTNQARQMLLTPYPVFEETPEEEAPPAKRNKKI
jgi:hypothetical protein